MPRQDKTPKKKKKSKEKSPPQESEESEDPAMDEATMNRLMQNAIEHVQAQAEQKYEERIKALEADREAQIKVVEDRLTKKFDEEVREIHEAYHLSHGFCQWIDWVDTFSSRKASNGRSRPGGVERETY